MTSQKPPATRYVLDDVRLAAALALAGLQPSESSNLPHTPLPPADPLSVLKESGLLAEDGRHLSHSSTMALRIAAHPARTICWIVNRAGKPSWREVFFLCEGESQGPFATLETRGRQYELTLQPDTAEVGTLLDDTLELTMLGEPASPATATLSLAGYVALLAVADALQETRLQSRLARQAPLRPVLTADLLERELDRGLSHEDTRWAVTASRRVCPVDPATVAGRMAAGLAELETAGLLREIPRGRGFTSTGEQMASALTDLVKTAGIALVIGRVGDRGAGVRASIFRCAQTILVGTWTQTATSDPSVSLFAASPTRAVDVIRELLENAAPQPSVASRFCPSCGTHVTAGNRFCTQCGTRLPERSP